MCEIGEGPLDAVGYVQLCGGERLWEQVTTGGTRWNSALSPLWLPASFYTDLPQEDTEMFCTPGNKQKFDF